ncbi:hypothetical protein [Fluviispira vulneris]|uniref:hypothetical protein n=1 Tax=Fluviispira vulneris TaxID=2763012 RepID=UPI001647F636|nr:hypothetical protein [Fluviispira vulneris]
MKKIFVLLPVISLLVASCGDKSNNNNNVTEQKPKPEDPTPVKPVDPAPQPEDPVKPVDPKPDPKPDPTPEPTPKPDPKPVDPIKPIDPVPINENESNIYLGKSGKIVINNKTGGYKIENPINGEFDYNNKFLKSSFYDSYQSDPVYGYKSSLFPVDKYSYIEIPQVIKFDKDKSTAGSPKSGNYNVTISIWGALGNVKEGVAYTICYKTGKNKDSYLDFIVNTDDNKKNETCDLLNKRLKNNEFSAIKLDDFILMRVYGFRFYSKGECSNINTCNIFHGFDLRYYTQK